MLVRLNRLSRLHRLHLSSAPLSVRPALGLRATVLRWLLLIALGAGLFIGGVFYGSYTTRNNVAMGNQQRTARLAALEQALQQETATRQRLEQQMKVDQAASQALAADLKNTQADLANRKRALDFFETLLSSNDRSRSARMLSCELTSMGDGVNYRYRLLLAQGQDRSKEFVGRTQVTIRYARKDLPAKTMAIEAKPQSIRFRHYQTVEGDVALPAGSMAQLIEARLFSGAESQSLADCQKRTGGE